VDHLCIPCFSVVALCDVTLTDEYFDSAKGKSVSSGDGIGRFLSSGIEMYAKDWSLTGLEQCAGLML